MAISKRDIPTLAQRGEDSDDDCVKREGLMSMLGDLSDRTAAVEDRLVELMEVLAPLVGGELDFERAREDDGDRASEFPLALAKIDHLRDRLTRIHQCIGELTRRVHV